MKESTPYPTRLALELAWKAARHQAGLPLQRSQVWVAPARSDSLEWRLYYQDEEGRLAVAPDTLTLTPSLSTALRSHLTTREVKD